MTIPPPCLLSLHILFSVGLLFLPQDAANALSDFLCPFYFLFQCKIPLIKRFPLGGLRFYFYRKVRQCISFRENAKHSLNRVRGHSIFYGQKMTVRGQNGTKVFFAVCCDHSVTDALIRR